MMGREKPTVKDGLMDENRLTKCGVRRKTRLTLPPALQRLQAQIVKELLCVLRDPKSRFVLVVPPLIQLFVFAFAATLEIRNIDIALMNRDAGGASVELVQQLASSDLIRRIHPATNEQEIARLIDAQEVIAAVVINDSFSRDIAAGKSGTAQLIIDGRRANAGQITLAYLQNIATNVGVTLNTLKSGSGSGEAVQVRHWFNPNLIYRWFVVPGLSAILTTFIAMLLTALSIAREREFGTFDQLLVSPCTPMEIIIAKMVPAFLISVLLACAMMAAAVFGFGIPFTGSLPLLLLCLMLFVLSLIGIGLMISSFCATQQQAIMGTFSFVVPTVLLSGFATPVSNMPVFLQWIAEAVPLKHFLIITHGCFLKALPPGEIIANAWPLLVIAVITLGLAVRFVRSRLQ